MGGLEDRRVEGLQDGAIGDAQRVELGDHGLHVRARLGLVGAVPGRIALDLHVVGGVGHACEQRVLLHGLHHFAQGGLVRVPVVLLGEVGMGEAAAVVGLHLGQGHGVDVQRPPLFGCHFIAFGGKADRAVHPRFVRHEHMSVAGDHHVQFERIAAQVHRLQEGGDAVLGQQPPAAAVAVDIGVQVLLVHAGGEGKDGREDRGGAERR
jgi:hypothetical protein